MFREFVILLCAATFVCGSAPHPAPTKSPVPTSAVNTQDLVALPSDTSYQNVATPQAKYLPTQASYQVNSAIVNTISQPTTPKSVSAQYGSSNANQQTVIFSANVAADPSSPEYSNILERYVPTAPPIQPYFASPVAAKTVTIESHGAGNAHGTAAHATHGYNVRPVVYINKAAPAKQYYTVPVAPAKTVVQSYRSINTHPPASHGTQHVAPAVAYATNSAAPRPYYAVPLSANAATVQSHGAFTAHSPAVTTYQVNHVQAINPPRQQYIPVSRVTYNVNPAGRTVSVPAVPVASKSVTIEAYNSVTAHPPPAPKYVTGPAVIQYGPGYAPESKLVPIPVVYHGVQTYQSGPQQVATAAATHVQAPVQPISVPVYYGRSRVPYPIPPISATPQKGYARAVVFSPASQVSRVTFNGLGVSYGF